MMTRKTTLLAVLGVLALFAIGAFVLDFSSDEPAAKPAASKSESSQSADAGDTAGDSTRTTTARHPTSTIGSSTPATTQAQRGSGTGSGAGEGAVAGESESFGAAPVILSGPSGAAKLRRGDVPLQVLGTASRLSLPARLERLEDLLQPAGLHELSNGSHTFAVAAVDALGNRGGSLHVSGSSTRSPTALEQAALRDRRHVRLQRGRSGIPFTIKGNASGFLLPGSGADRGDADQPQQHRHLRHRSAHDRGGAPGCPAGTNIELQQAISTPLRRSASRSANGSTTLPTRAQPRIRLRHRQPSTRTPAGAGHSTGYTASTQ